MIRGSIKPDEYEALGDAYCVKTLKAAKDAKRIVDFFLSENSFDDRNFTIGEIIQMETLPNESLKDPGFRFWYAESSEDEIIGVISLRENEQKSGGYFIDYLAVHRQNRKRGIANKLIDIVIEHVKLLNGRYLYAYTCDTALYEGVRRLFEKKGFFRAGFLPDYYFEGESMVIYYRKI